MAQPALRVPPPEPPGRPAPPALDAEEKRPWYNPRTFAAFDFEPFRWYMGAMIWWNAAMSMQMLVRGYLAYDLTDDFRALGVVGLGSAIPMLLLSPFGGVIADRTSRRLVLQVGQTFSLVVAVVVAALLFAGMLEFWHLFLASVAQGLMMSLVMPSRQAFLPEVVGLRRLMNAIPLQSAGMNLMQIMAPTLGGFLIDWIGPGSVYSFMAAMYGMSVIMLFRVKSLSAEEQEAERSGTAAASAGGPGGRPMGRPQRRGGTFSELKGGFSYIFKDFTVLSILAFAFLGSVLGMPIRMLLAGYVADVFDDSGTTLGLLQMGMGLGALIGALGLASLRMTSRRGLLLAGSSALMGIAMLGFGSTEVKLLAWIGLFIIGVGSAGRQAMSQVLVQEYVDDAYRGRVMSIFMMQFSLMSVGTFIVSLYMEAVGPQFAISSLGIVLMAAVALYLLLVPRFRRLA